MEKIRSFIAIELPESLKTELAGLQSKLKVEKPRIKWVSPDSIHLTLKFLGDIDATAIDRIEQAMTEAVNDIKPFGLSTGQLGVFPKSGWGWRGKSMYWTIFIIDWKTA
jgi:2'-5' RNA ligase